ncbi:MAG: apolipoprotein N-acyltransferase, partial [Ignavibacteria bacterium]|nr:apolipoprotein N-acyltransferase [Ignavibacteria bacterium]
MVGRKNQSLLTYLISLFGGFLLYLSWHPFGITILIFIAFVPFLYLDNKGRPSSFAIFTYSLPGFFLFHVFAGWWMYSSTIAGSLLAHLFNAVYMALVMFLWSFGNKYLKKSIWSLVLLVVFWTSFEFLHHHWELAWPWFTLGHVFAEKPHWVQWYSITGSFGGTIWILFVNWLIYKSITSFWYKDFKQGLIIITIAVLSIALPLLFSFQMNKTPQTETAST